MAAWLELLGMLGGSLDEGSSGGFVSQVSLAELIGVQFPFATATVENADHLGLGDIDADDAALMGAVLVAQRALQPVVPVTSYAATLDEGSTTSIQGEVPMPPLVGFFEDPDDPVLFAQPSRDSVWHGQIGPIQRNTSFEWLEATEVQVQKFVGHQENLQIVRDWTRLADLKSGIIWDFYLRGDIAVGYRVRYRGNGTTAWSAWHFQENDGDLDTNEPPSENENVVAKPGAVYDPEIL